MCWICDHPGATEQDYTEHMRRLITAHGWAVQGVEREGIHPPWAYTVGLTAHRRPEMSSSTPHLLSRHRTSL